MSQKHSNVLPLSPQESQAAENSEVESIRQRSKQHFLDLLLAHLPLITYVCKADEDYGALLCSGLSEKITGFRPEAFIENSSLWLDRLHPEDRQRILTELDALFKNDQHVQEYRWKHRDGHYIWLTDILHLIRTEEGRPEYIVGAWYDTTERKANEEELADFRKQLQALVRQRTAELRAANEKLQEEMQQRTQAEAAAARAQRLESLSVLAGGIAHDFNNILTGVLGNIELVQTSLEAGGADHKRLELAQKACLQARELTGQLVTFARGGPVELKETAITPIVEEVLALHGSDRQRSCELRAAKDLWPVRLNETKFTQLLSNLLLNALESKAGAHTVIVQLENAVLHEQGEPQHYVRLSVLDEGEGIAPELLETICDPYVSTKENGHGLGLAMAYAIVKQHKGSIRFDSTPGEGTCVEVLFPASV